MRLPTHPATRTVAIALVCICIAITPLAAPAEPSNPEIEAKQAEALEARAQLEELQAQLELRAEEYAVINADLQTIRGEIASTEAELEIAERDQALATDLLERRVSASYRSGGVQVIEVFLGTTSFGDFLTRMEWLRRVSESDASMLASVKVAKGRVRDARAKLERREEEQIVLRDRAKTKQREIERALADQETYVAGIDAEVGKLVHEEQERLDRIAEERARIAREEAARAAAAAARAAVNTGSVTPVDPATLGQGHPEVVDVALSFIGVPYHWAGSGPGMCPDGTHDICFDCSGLTWYSFKRIGIDIPRSSSLQWNSGLGQRIPASQTDLLRAGDLVFFGYGGDPNHVHHVGIYVGNGDFVHAPQTGKPVLVMPLSMRSDYVGAVRL